MMWIRRTCLLAALIGAVPAANAQSFSIAEVASARNTAVAQIKPDTVAFSDKPAGSGADAGLGLVRFEDWAQQHPTQKRFLALYPSYAEPMLGKAKNGAKPAVQKLDMYVAQARFVLDRAPAAIDLSRYVTVDFLTRIDPAIRHRLITPADVAPLTGKDGIGNENPQRKWCTGLPNAICIASTYRLEGKIPLGIMLVNKLRDSEKKISPEIDFQSEFSARAPADLDQAGLQQLTKLGAPVGGVLEQDIFHVNQIMKFGKFFAVFQADPADPGKTVVTAFMALALKANIFDEKRSFEKVPVLRNLVPADVLMGRSSFNSGYSISAGLPRYARNEIRTVAGLLAKGAAAK
jgi:hypothetical protein